MRGCCVSNFGSKVAEGVVEPCMGRGCALWAGRSNVLWLWAAGGRRDDHANPVMLRVSAVAVGYIE